MVRNSDEEINFGSVMLDGTSNFWSTTSPEAVQDRISDFLDNSKLPFVKTDPLLDAPRDVVACSLAPPSTNALEPSVVDTPRVRLPDPHEPEVVVKGVRVSPHVIRSYGGVILVHAHITGASDSSVCFV